MEKLGIKVMTHPDLIEISTQNYVRHNYEILAKMIYEIAINETETIEFNRDEKTK